MSRLHKRDLRRLRERINSGDEISSEAATLLNDIDEALTNERRRTNNISVNRHRAVLLPLFTIAKQTNLLPGAFSSERGQTAINQILDWIDEKEYASNTKSSYNSALRKGAKALYDVDDPSNPDSI